VSLQRLQVRVIYNLTATSWLSFRRSLETIPAFIQHLRSAAHRDEKLKCRNCLRYFATATALTQHSESQGFRCRVRDTDQYPAAVDEFTAGTAFTAGRHTDNTVRYMVNAALYPGASGVELVIAANKNANAAKEEEFNSYWDHHKPKWWFDLEISCAHIRSIASSHAEFVVSIIREAQAMALNSFMLLQTRQCKLVSRKFLFGELK